MSHVRFGYKAVVQVNITRRSASEGKAAVKLARKHDF